MNVIEELEKQEIEKLLEARDIPIFAPGDTLRVNVKVVEGSRERLQAFEGVCIGRKNAGLNSAFTVRKLSYGEGDDYSIEPGHDAWVVSDIPAIAYEFHGAWE